MNIFIKNLNLLSNLHKTTLESFHHILVNNPELQESVFDLCDQLREKNKLPKLIEPLIKRYCVGNGLEIGPGKNPYCNPETTLFLDKYTTNRDGTVNPDIISDAKYIPMPDENFDYILSSHVLEHMQDTIGALKEWIRVLKTGGILFLLLPHADRTFDKHRDKTTLEHHILDHEKLTDSPDNSHNEEIKIGWLKNENAEQSSIEYRNQWGADTWDFDFRHKNGIIHFHVWTQNEIIKLLQYLNLTVLWVSEEVEERNDTFIVVSKKN